VNASCTHLMVAFSVAEQWRRFQYVQHFTGNSIYRFSLWIIAPGKSYVDGCLSYSIWKKNSFIGSLILQKIKEYNAVYLITNLNSRLSYQCHFSYKSILLACYVPLWIPKTVTVTSQTLGSVSSLLMFDPTIQPFKSKISIV
jgi:hypothetical protein